MIDVKKKSRYDIWAEQYTQLMDDLGVDVDFLSPRAVTEGEVKDD